MIFMLFCDVLDFGLRRDRDGKNRRRENSGMKNHKFSKYFVPVQPESFATSVPNILTTEISCKLFEE